jgi:threonine synthase
MWRYHEFLPVDPDQIVSLAEGCTPLLNCPALARRIGIERLLIKDESRNPTWSFKDRLASVAASRALQTGYRVLTAASSGNGGAATAAYAARSGLDAVIVTTAEFPMTMRVLMQAYGARILRVRTREARWELVRRGVQEFGWFPVQNFLVPPIGANPFALDGCKTLGYEICEDLGFCTPHWIFFPITSGDSMVGTWKGIREWLELGLLEAGSRMPRMGAAEVFGSLKDAVARGLDHTEAQPLDHTVATSAGAANSAYQALKVLRETNGVAETASDDEIMDMQRSLAADEGVYAEPSAVLPLAVLKKCVERGEVRASDVVVVVLTSSGLKDPEATAGRLEEIPLVEDGPAGLDAVLASIKFDGQAALRSGRAVQNSGPTGGLSHEIC